MAKIDPEKWEQVERLHNMNVPSKEIANIVELSISQVWRYRQKMRGYSLAKPPLTEDELAFAKKLLDDGASYAEVGRTFGRSRHAISDKFPGRGWDVDERIDFMTTMRKAKDSYSNNRISSSQIVRAKKLLESGASFAEAARGVGANKATLYKYLPEYKKSRTESVEIANSSRWERNGPKIEEAKKLLDSGWTHHAAAKEIGISATTLYRHFPLKDKDNEW